MSIFCIRLSSFKFCERSLNLVKCIRPMQFYISYRFLTQKLDIYLKPFIPFTELISNRKAQATRSLLVQVQSAHSYKELYAYCSTFSTVKQMFHYSAGVEPLHFIIVEFSKEDDVPNILSRSTYPEHAQIVPVQSLFLWFRAPSKKVKSKASKNVKLEIENGTHIPNESEIRSILRDEKNISDQMMLLYNITKLNDVSTRLRFIVARQIETALSGIFPHVIAYPFGSSVNGFGRMGCDLDLVLRLNQNIVITADSRLVFHSKAVTASERSTSQRYMEAIGDLLQLFLPGCSQVRRILQARVPIIKYYQHLADVECDLSMLNMSGVHMSDFLHIMGECDYRVRPLVFTIRKWASEVGLTSSYPGRWITNFSLTLMVLAFLQNRTPPVLPDLNLLVKSAGPKDTFITDDGINCTFLRNLNELHFKPNNSDNLQILLEQFFEYYSQFDFSTKAVCLNNGSTVTKPDHSPLYIVNPLERGLNVSKNVSLEELERLKMEMRNAAWVLESQEVKGMNWGILSLFENKKKIDLPTQKQTKLLEVSKLFNEEGNTPNIDSKNNVDEQILTSKSQIKDNVKQIESSPKRGRSRR